MILKNLSIINKIKYVQSIYALWNVTSNIFNGTKILILWSLKFLYYVKIFFEMEHIYTSIVHKRLIYIDIFLKEKNVCVLYLLEGFVYSEN